jgi:hypothetical protein
LIFNPKNARDEVPPLISVPKVGYIKIAAKDKAMDSLVPNFFAEVYATKNGRK